MNEIPETWERVEVSWSPEAYQKIGEHRQVWLNQGDWVGHWGGFLLRDRFPTAAEAIAAIDKIDASMPEPGSVWSSR